MRFLAALVALCGCNGNKDEVVPTGETGDTETPTPGPIRSDEGSVVVLSRQASAIDPNENTTLLGIFVETRRSVLNLAQCFATGGTFCVEELPRNPGDSVVVTPLDLVALQEDLDTRKVGPSITLGDWVGDYQYSSDTDIGYYYAAWTDVTLPSEPLGLHLAGDWGPYDGTADVTPPAPLRVTSPDPLEVQDFFDSIPIHLEWDSGGEGDIYLLAESPVETRLWLLEDTGSYDLDLSALGLNEGDTIDLMLGRWSHAIVDHDGHEVVLDIQSNQMIRGSWRTIGSRSEMLDSYDECVDAQSAPSAVPGNYYGELAGSTADLNPTPTGCTGFAATGIDRVIPIDLLPEDLLTVNYQLVADDASLYLVTDCSSAQTCLTGRDTGGRGDVEQISWFNDTGAELRVYAVLDAFNDVTDMYNLDIIIESLGGDILVPTCVDAINQGPAAAGDYHGSIAGHADLLQPKCAAPATGAEGMTQILLAPGERLTADVEAPNGDPKLYLLSNCAIGDSCFLASTTDGGDSEKLVYENTTASSQYMYLVLDADQNLDEYFLDIAIQ